MLEKKDDSVYFFPTNVLLSNTLIVCNFQTIQAWGYGNNFHIGIVYVKNGSAFKLGFIRSYICWKNNLDEGIKVQIFHPDSQSLSRMASCNFTLSTAQEGQELLEQVQQDTKMIREVEYMSVLR